MKKLILGIVAVFSLQIGFVALTTSDNAREVAVRDLAGEAEPDPLFSMIEDAETAPDLSRPLLTDDIATLDPPAHKRPWYRPMPVAHRSRPTLDRSKAVKASRSTDKLKTRYASRHDTSDEVAAKEKPRTKSKPFIAKAAPIIKKPYDWLKAIASKLR